MYQELVEVSRLPTRLRLSYRGERGFELEEDRKVFAANLDKHARDCFKVTAASGNFSGSKCGGESRRMNCPGARLERVRGDLDRLGVATRYRLFEGGETSRGIFNECGEQWPKHLVHAGFAQLRAEAVDINAR
jgi:hypothetical protein